MRILLLSLSACIIFSTAIFAGEVKVVDQKPCYKITSDGQPVFDYRYADVPFKPYVVKFYTPSGINILRDSPSDHIHHHGLMFAVAIDGTHFWSEYPKWKPGKEVTTKIEALPDGITSTLDYINPAGEKLANETRTVRTATLEGKGFKRPTLINWCTTLACPEDREKVVVSGHDYFGLGMRFLESMDNGGRFFFGHQEGESRIVRNDERMTQAKWAAYTAKLDGKPVTVAMFDSPGNPFPMYAFTMGDKSDNFAYLSAALNLKKVSRELKAGHPFSFCWGVALWDGEATPAEVEAAYQAWCVGQGSP